MAKDVQGWLDGAQVNANDGCFGMFIGWESLVVCGLLQYIATHAVFHGPDTSPSTGVKRSLHRLVLSGGGKEHLVVKRQQEEVVLEI